MKKNLILLLALVLGAMAFAGCSEDKLNSQSAIVDSRVPLNALDKWCLINYVEPYNIDFHYRLNDVWTDVKVNVSPASYQNSVRMAKLTLHLCIQPYDEVTGSQAFMRQNFVKILHLIGSGAYTTEGELLGTAEGGKVINLYKINALEGWIYPEPDMAMLNYYFFHTMHHEFTHILHQTKPYSRDFVAVGSKYRGDNWSELSAKGQGVPDPLALKEGFITAYASKAYDEDFAENISVYVTDTAAEWENRLTIAGASGRKIIEAKFEIAFNYMRDTWGINLDTLRASILRRQSEIKMLDLENL